MKTYEVKIEGIAPLLMNRYVERSKTPKTDEDKIKGAEERMYVNEKGKLYIPGRALKKATGLAVYYSAPKTKRSETSQIFKSSVFFEDEMLLDQKKYDYIHKERVVLQGRASIMRWWCGLKKWSFTAKAQIFEAEIITEDYLREMIKFAGIRFGLLDHRPDFGRYVVKEFKLMS